MADNDTQLELKKRARRRLVGAAAVALFAAIVLPMVMDHEPRQSGQDIQVRIPSQEGANFASRAIQGQDAAPLKPALPPPVKVAPEPSARAQTQPSAAAASTPSSPAGNPAPEASRPLANPTATNTKPLSPQPSASSTHPEIARPEPKPEKKTQPAPESQRAAAILNDQAPKAAKFAVQLGAFKDSSNVASVRAKLKAEGYSSFVESLGDKTRVRAGPFATREAAEAAAAKLRKAGLPASVSPLS